MELEFGFEYIISVSAVDVCCWFTSVLWCMVTPAGIHQHSECYMYFEHKMNLLRNNYVRDHPFFSAIL